MTKYLVLFKDETGSSIIEVMVATMVFIIIMVAGVNFYFLPQATIGRQKTKRLVVSAARDRMEKLIALQYAGVTPDSNETNTPVTVGNTTINRTTTITEVDDAADGLSGADADSDTVDYKLITVAISWNDSAQSLSFSTIVSIDDSTTPPAPPPPLFAEWGRKCELVIQSSQVPANLTDFPLLLTEATLPTEMLDADGTYPALNGGGDLRFSSDSNGTTRLSCEIATFTTDNNPALGKAEIWVKVPTVLSSSNTSIWVWYDSSAASQPAPDSAYGSESVWDSNYKGVWHMDSIGEASTIFEDGFEGSGAAWDDKWQDNGVTSWNQASDQVTAGSFSAKATNGSEGVFTSNDIDASSATSLSVDFWFHKDDTETTDFTLFYFDGTSYDLIVELATQGADDTWLNYSALVTDSQYLISNFRIRIDATLGNNENVWVDSLQVMSAALTEDSTPNGNTGVKSGPVEGPGQIGNAQLFDGSDDYIDAGSVADNIDVTKGTVSGWVELTSTAAASFVFNVKVDDWNIISMHWQADDAGFKMRYEAAGWTQDVLIPGGALIDEDDGEQHFVALTWDKAADEVKAFFEGAQYGSTLTGLGVWDGGPIGADQVGIGKNLFADAGPLGGMIDEVRVSSVARSADLITAEFNNQDTPATFVIEGTPETP